MGFLFLLLLLFMFLLVLLRTAHVLLRLLLQLILSVKLLMLPSANAVSHSSGNMVYRFCLGASNLKKKKKKIDLKQG